MTRRCDRDGGYREGVVRILACALLLSIGGCRSRACVVAPPTRAVEAHPALAAGLHQRVTDALTTPGGATLTLREEELTAALRQALEGSPIVGATLHVAEDAVYAQATVGRRRTPVQVSLIPAARDGRLAVRVACLVVNGRRAPRIIGAVTGSVLDALAEDAAWSLPIEAITLREGAIVIVTGPRPTSGA